MARPSLDEIFGSTQTVDRPSLDEIFGTQKPKPQFATMDEARAAMANADYNLRQAQAEADGGYIETGIHDFERNWYNSLFSGIPDIMSRKLSNRPFIKPGTENIPAQIAGTIIGPGAIGTGVTNLLGRGATSTLAKIGAGAAGGAVSGALTAPSDGTDMTARTVQGILGLGIGAAVPATGAAIKGIADGARSLSTRLSGTKSAEFADKIRKAFVDVKRNAVSKFGRGLDELSAANPKTKIDIYENTSVSDILTDPNLPTETKNIFNRTPILRDIISGKRDSKLTLKEAQEVINYIQDKVPAKIKASNLDLPEFLSEMRLAQSNAFPEKMAALRSEYARIAQPFKDVKSQFRFNTLLKSIDTKFGGPEANQAVKELFKETPEVLQKMGGYRKAGILIKGALTGAGAVGLGALTKAGYDMAQK